MKSQIVSDYLAQNTMLTLSTNTASRSATLPTTPEAPKNAQKLHFVRETLVPTKGLKIRLNFATYGAYVGTVPTGSGRLSAVHADGRRGDELVARVVVAGLLVLVAVEGPRCGRRGRGGHCRIVCHGRRHGRVPFRHMICTYVTVLRVGDVNCSAALAHHVHEEL